MFGYRRDPLHRGQDLRARHTVQRHRQLYAHAAPADPPRLALSP